MQAHNAAVAHKQALMDRQGSLAAAETELSSLQSQLSALAAAVKDAEARSAKLEQELVESKHRVDVAQARKEEVGLCS
jgi:peptidoglycan hydrolase CwlO-like protein